MPWRFRYSGPDGPSGTGCTPRGHVSGPAPVGTPPLMGERALSKLPPGRAAIAVWCPIMPRGHLEFTPRHRLWPCLNWGLNPDLRFPGTVSTGTTAPVRRDGTAPAPRGRRGTWSRLRTRKTPLLHLSGRDGLAGSRPLLFAAPPPHRGGGEPGDHFPPRVPSTLPRTSRLSPNRRKGSGTARPYRPRRCCNICPLPRP